MDKLYSVETVTQVTEDGGKTWRALGNNHRHVDDHAFWVDPANTNYMLIGGDGGVYESYDAGKNWRHFDNLPVTQFYRVTADNSLPFYYVYGGTQDNNTWGGPSRTTNSGGILNDDWFMIVGGDGYEPQIDPVDPNIVYGQWQYGNLVRFDRKTGETVYVQPQPEKGEEHRWNWDSPVLISPHSHTRLYMACNRLYKSDDRGNTWKAISPDLTRQIDRDKLPVMGKIWGPEAVAKSASTSIYGNTISITESPKKEGLIYVGTDDGLIQVTDNGGESWKKIDKFASVPETTYVSDVFASVHNENVVYATFNNHKNNDFKPYVLKSSDKGSSWVSIASDLPDDQPVWTIVEDHVNPNLLFVGTEFGVYCTVDGGKKWIQLKGGLPSIAIRDLEIQKREDDLILGTFGRSIYILDNYAPLREITSDLLEKDAYIFPIKDALMFLPDESRSKNELGETFFRAKNPEITAVFTYYLKDGIKTKKDIRKETEAADEKAGNPIKYSEMSELKAEDLEEAPFLILTITDEQGNVIRKLNTPATQGINRVNWDLCYASINPVSKDTKTERYSGFPVVPGKYKVSISKSIDGKITELAPATEFNVKLLENQTLPAKDKKAVDVLHRKISKLEMSVNSSNRVLGEINTRLDLIKVSLYNTPNASKDLIEKVRQLEYQLNAINITINGDGSIGKRNANQTPSMSERVNSMIMATGAFSEPTNTALENYKIIVSQYNEILKKLKGIIESDIPNIEKEMDKVQAPWTPGRMPEEITE